MIPVRLTVEKSGGNLVFSPNDVRKLTYGNSVSLDGNQVPSDEAEITIRQSPDGWESAWNGVHRGCPVWISRLIPGVNRSEKYFYKSLTRVGKNLFILTIQSPIGRILSKHPGDLYKGEDLPTVLADVIGNGIPYVCNPVLSAVKVYGWVPYQSRRKTLQDLMFAYGFIVRRDNDQKLYFTVPTTDSYAIPRNAIYIGGSVDYRTGNDYARVDVTTKELVPDSSVKEKTLFDNVSSGAIADNLLVTFDSPMHSLSTTSGLTIQNNNYGANHAVVSGLGTLTGKPYTIIESVVSVNGDANADPENILSVSNAAFITNLNAVSVAERLLGVRRAVTVSVNIRRTNQYAGDLVTFEDPFGDIRTGYIDLLRGDITSIDKAATEIICGYSPTWGNDYDAVFVLTGSDTWTVPAQLHGKTLRVVLIGGGTGGASGQHGTDDNATGGEKGAPGSGGKILEIRLKNVTGGTSYNYQCGSGGAGGTPTDNRIEDEDRAGVYHYVSNAGSAGSATTFGNYSSNDGAYSGVGFYDIIHRESYAVPGPDNGVDGGKATTGKENGNRNDPLYVDVERPEVQGPTENWFSGENGGGKWRNQTGDYAYQEWAYGGHGGGAAIGADGANGSNAQDSDWGGRGGDGANASAIFPSDTRAYGSGGSGGHGGGEGGQGGSGNSTETTNMAQNGPRGTGGSGSNGQQGKEGCVLIYYKSYS